MLTETNPDTSMTSKHWLAGLCIGLATSAGAIAATSVNVSIDGLVSPGVYGRINIGNSPPPVLVYQQPVVIYQTVRPVQASPIYLHVPPGQSRDWARYCRQYNACGQPVYFVRSAEYEPGYRYKHEDKDEYKRKDKHKDKHDNGKGRGRGHDKDD